MNRMMKKLKLVICIACLLVLTIIMSCGPQFEEAFDADEQLAIDIELIENYLAIKGYTDYDTLDNDIRALVLDEGIGEFIEPNDIITFHYLGIFLSDTIFDTSIAEIAFEQDTTSRVGDIVFEYIDDVLSLDMNGLPVISEITYKENYSPIYNSTRTYSNSKTTHTQSGWFTDQLLSSGYISGYAPAVNYALFNCKIGGRSLALIPSYMAYGNNPTYKDLRNKVLMFEIRPVQKR